MLVLVTGASGFLGSHVASQLVQEGHCVRVFMRSSSAKAPAGCEVVFGDLSDSDSLGRATNGAEVVYHCAALVSDWGPLSSFRAVNRDGVKTLLEACAASRVRRFVQVSTLDVLGWRNRMLLEEAEPVHTGFAYPDTKGEGETLVKQLAPASNIEYSIIRPGWIYGPGDRQFLPEIVDALRKGNALLIALGRRPAPVVFIENLVPALVQAGQNENASGKCFHLVDDPVPTWAEFFNRIARRIGVATPTFSLSPDLAYICAAVLESWAKVTRQKTRPLLTRYIVRYWSSDFEVETARARADLGFRTAISLEEGLQRTLSPAGYLS